MVPLKEYHAIFSPLLRRREQREWMEFYLQGLLSPEMDRKSIEPMVLNIKGADENAVRAVQQFIGEGGWEDDPIRKRHWVEVNTTLGEDDGVMVLDGSDFPKQGKESVGVKRQYCGELGKRANCQAGVFAGYASTKGYTLLDARLYMPEVWFSKEFEARRRKCRVPDAIHFQTKNELTWEMIEAIEREGTLRFRWITCDEAFGCDTWLLDRIASLQRWYFAEVPRDTFVWTHRPETFIPLETCFEDGKQFLGMGDYEVRSWTGWHHHMTLRILAHHFLVRVQQEFKKNSEADLTPSGAIVGAGPAQAKGGLPYGCRCARVPNHP
jgi:SRSO17 transposase